MTRGPLERGPRLLCAFDRLTMNKEKRVVRHALAEGVLPPAEIALSRALH